MNEHPTTGKTTLRRDIVAVALLVSVVTAFLFPLVDKRWPAVFDDCPIESLPGLMKTASMIQSQALPLWNESTFAGAKPLYVDNAYLGFYPLMYPFFLMADTGDLAQSHTVLMLLPFALHIIWAALGTYLFGRCVLRVNPLAAWVMALAYSLSPDMGFQLVTSPIAMTLSYIPWCSLALGRYLQSGLFRWWIGSTLLLALMCSTGNPNFLIRAYFMLAVMVTLAWIIQVFQVWRGDFVEPTDEAPRQERLLLRFLAAIVVFPLAIGLTAIAWGGTFEAVHWIEESISLTPQSVASFAVYSSMFPLRIVTMFVPGFFGDLDPRHTWGVGQLLSHHGTLTGGMFVMFALCSAFAGWWRGRHVEENVALSGTSPAWPGHRNESRQWAVVALILLIGSLLTMMGRYTPFFAAACNLLPWFFEFPHPVYYRLGACWSIAILIGLGLSSLSAESRYSIRSAIWSWTALACISAAAAALGLGLIWGADGSWISSPGYTTLTARDDWRWWFMWPGFYFAVSSLILIALTWWNLPRALGRCVALGAIAEILFIAWAMFYNTSNLGAPSNAGREASFQRVTLAEEYPLVEPVLTMMRHLVQDGQYRCVGVNSILDNEVWYIRGRALMGYSAKPLIPWYTDVVNRFTTGNLALVMHQYPEQLLRNMNVRYLFMTANENYFLQKLGIDETVPVPGTIVMREGSFVAYELASPLPYVYVQPRVVECPIAQQLDKLFQTDLRSAVFVDRSESRRLPLVDEAPSVLANEQIEQQFVAVQRANPVSGIMRPRGNEVIIDVELAEPAMLVINECWHPGWSASIDDEPIQLRRVNYLQQGVWLAAGRHQVQLRFFPRSVRNAVIVMAASWLLLLVIVVVMPWTRSFN